jgi:hypothetical protein
VALAVRKMAEEQFGCEVLWKMKGQSSRSCAVKIGQAEQSNVC